MRCARAGLTPCCLTWRRIGVSATRLSITRDGSCVNKVTWPADVDCERLTASLIRFHALSSKRRDVLFRLWIVRHLRSCVCHVFLHVKVCACYNRYFREHMNTFKSSCLKALYNIAQMRFSNAQFLPAIRIDCLGVVCLCCDSLVCVFSFSREKRRTQFISSF